MSVAVRVRVCVRVRVGGIGGRIGQGACFDEVESWGEEVDARLAHCLHQPPLREKKKEGMKKKRGNEKQNQTQV